MPADPARVPSAYECALGRRQAYAACPSRGTVLTHDCRQSRLPLTLRQRSRVGFAGFSSVVGTVLT